MLWAAEHGRLELAQQLLDQDPDLHTTRDEDGYTALHRAAYNNETALAELLVRQIPAVLVSTTETVCRVWQVWAGADPRAVTPAGWTPLHSAARWDSLDCVELLLPLVPVNTATQGGQTPLHLAAQVIND